MRGAGDTRSWQGLHQQTRLPEESALGSHGQAVFHGNTVWAYISRDCLAASSDLAEGQLEQPLPAQPCRADPCSPGHVAVLLPGGTGWHSPFPAPQEWAAGSPARMLCWEGQVPTRCPLAGEVPSCELLEEPILSCLCL